MFAPYDPMLAKVIVAAPTRDAALAGLGRALAATRPCGPHGVPGFFTDDDVSMFFGTDWQVHCNSSRTGVRLIGPKPQWARADGGEAGLHPPNIHDNAYAIRTVDFTGDMPVNPGPDGPSLGGFICPATIVQAELWKMGQLAPGDTVRFHRIIHAQADRMLREQNAAISGESLAMPLCADCSVGDDAVLRRLPALREAGALPGIIDLTPGIRSLQVHYDSSRLALSGLMDALLKAEQALPRVEDTEVPTRTVWLPLSWDDAATRLAIEKYMQSVRAGGHAGRPAPSPGHHQVQPGPHLDPGECGRHRRRLRVRVRHGRPGRLPVRRPHHPDVEPLAAGRRLHRRQALAAALLRPDPLPPMEANALLQCRKDFLAGRVSLKIEEGRFRLADYQRLLADKASSIAAFKEAQQAAFDAERERWAQAGLSVAGDSAGPAIAPQKEIAADCDAVTSQVAGSIWKVQVQAGDRVRAGDTLMIVESMKMEMQIAAPRDGEIVRIAVAEGQGVTACETLAVLR